MCTVGKKTFHHLATQLGRMIHCIVTKLYYLRLLLLGLYSVIIEQNKASVNLIQMPLCLNVISGQWSPYKQIPTTDTAVVSSS